MPQHTPGDPDSEQLATPEETHSAWKALSIADKKRLAAYAARMARMHQVADAGMTWEDLIQGSTERVLYGPREWKLKRDSFVKFMYGVIRSLAGDLCRTNAGKVRAASRSEDAGETDEDEQHERVPITIEYEHPESLLIAREDKSYAESLLEALHVEFEDEEGPFYVLECVRDGLLPRQIRERLNMGEKEYDAIRKTIERRCRKLLLPN